MLDGMNKYTNHTSSEYIVQSVECLLLTIMSADCFVPVYSINYVSYLSFIQHTMSAIK